MSARTIRRAAERAARKAERKLQTHPLNVPPPDANSTGPATAEPRAISSRNAIKHGACAVTTLILANESYEDYLQLEKRNFAGYGYGGGCLPMAAELVRAISRAEWVYLRSERNYLEAEARIVNETPDVFAWTEEHHRTLARFQRYRTANFNVLLRARKAIEDFRQARAREHANTLRDQQTSRKLAMAEERLKIYHDRHREMDFDEEIEKMREKAIRLGFLNPDGTPGPRKA